MKEQLHKIDSFLKSQEVHLFDIFTKNNLDVNLNCLGINIKNENIISIKKYTSFKNNHNLKGFLKIPFINHLYSFKDNDITTNTSPAIAIKFYPEFKEYKKYFHLKFCNEYFLKNKSFFNCRDDILNQTKKVGISIEEKTITKYYYINCSKIMLPELSRKFFTNTKYNKIEYVQYKNKEKFIIDEEINLNTITYKNENLINFSKNVESQYGLKFKTGGKDSEGIVSLYFF